MTYTEPLERKPSAARAGWWRFVGRHLPSLSVMLLASMLVATDRASRMPTKSTGRCTVV